MWKYTIILSDYLSYIAIASALAVVALLASCSYLKQLPFTATGSIEVEFLDYKGTCSVQASIKDGVIFTGCKFEKKYEHDLFLGTAFAKYTINGKTSKICKYEHHNNDTVLFSNCN